MVRPQVLTKEERLKANWEGMVKWWGLPDSDGNHRPPAQSNFRKEEEEYLLLNRRTNFWDPVERVFEIAPLFHHHDSDEEDQGDEELHKEYIGREKKYITPADYHGFLDELKHYVESIDVADELDAIYALEPLLYKVMYNKHAAVRAKAAELVSAIVHDNPNSQRLVLEAEGLPPLLYNFNSDPDVTVRIKALGAISSLIWNNKPGVSEFQLNDGYAKLKDALTFVSSVMLQREALNLILYLLHENSSDCNIVTELGLPRIMMHLASSDDAEVREAALRCLLVLTRDEEGGNSAQLVKNDDNLNTRDEEGGNSALLVKNDDNLKQVLQELIEGISAMAPEDLGAVREERQLVDSLWNVCYNEPSSLREKGLLVLPGEDPPGPDVASKLFEPPTRAWAAAEVTDRNSVGKKLPPDFPFPLKTYPSWKLH